MARTLGTKQIDSLISSIYYPNCSGIQIDILDIPKVFAVGRAAYKGASNWTPDAQRAAMTTAIVDFVQTIRKN